MTDLITQIRSMDRFQASSVALPTRSRRKILNILQGVGFAWNVQCESGKNVTRQKARIKLQPKTLKWCERRLYKNDK